MCLNPKTPQTCPASAPAPTRSVPPPPNFSTPPSTPSLAPATAPTQATDSAQAPAPAGGLSLPPAPDPGSGQPNFYPDSEKQPSSAKKQPSSVPVGIIAGAVSVLVAFALACFVLAFYVRRSKRRASDTGGAVGRRPGEDIVSLNAGPATDVGGGAPPLAPSAVASAAVSNSNALIAPREAGAPAAVAAPGKSLGIRGAGNQDNVPVEDVSAMPTPDVLPPTDPMHVEHRDTGNSARSFVVQQQVRTQRVYSESFRILSRN
jgi:hypothetical protein